MESPHVRKSRSHLITTVLLALAVLIPSLYGFAGKFIEFLHIYGGESDGVFAITPILNYLLASTGFFCLFCWAMIGGMFRDIEAPKQVMLENEAQLDQFGGNRYV